MKRKHILMLVHEPITRSPGLMTTGELCDVHILSLNDVMDEVKRDIICSPNYSLLLLPEELKEDKMMYVADIVNTKIVPIMLEHANWRDRIVYY